MVALVLLGAWWVWPTARVERVPLPVEGASDGVRGVEPEEAGREATTDWAAGMLARLEGAMAACGVSAVVACEGDRCVVSTDFDPDFIWRPLLRRPAMVVERWLALAGAPREIDRCQVAGQRLEELGVTERIGGMPLCQVFAKEPAPDLRVWGEPMCAALRKVH